MLSFGVQKHTKRTTMKTYRVTTSKGVFEGKDLYSLLNESNAENEAYTWSIIDNGVETFTEKINRSTGGSPNGPTGHGDMCYSDADPGL